MIKSETIKSKAISEVFFEQTQKYESKGLTKNFIILENETLTYSDISTLCKKFIFSYKEQKLEQNDFYILSSNPKIIIVSYLALNYMNKNVHITADNVRPLLLDLQEKENNSNLIYIVEKVEEKKSNKYRTFAELLSDTPYSFSKEEINMDRTSALVQFTSGTSGTPKRIIRTKSSCYIEALDLVNVWEIDESSKVACFLPLTYSFAFGNVVVASIIAGATIISCNSFNIKKVIPLLVDNQASHFVTVVSIIKLLLIQKNKQKLSFLKHLICSGSKIEIKDARKFKKKFKINVAEQYGMTETGSLLYSYKVGKYFTGVFPSVEIELKNDILYVFRKNCDIPQVKTNDYAKILKNNGVRIIGRADGVLKLDDKRYSVAYIESLFQKDDYLTLAKQIIGQKKIEIPFNKENKKAALEVIKKLKQLDSSIRIVKKHI